MQYTIRNIPKEVDKALRKKAKAEGKSLNQAAVDALKESLGVAAQPVKKRDLTGIAGTWVEDPEFDRIMEEQDQIDPELWK